MIRKQKMDVVSAWIVIIFSVIAVTLVSMFLLVYNSIITSEERANIRQQATVLRDNADLQVLEVIQNQAARTLATKDASTGYIDFIAKGNEPDVRTILELTEYFGAVKASVEACERVELYFPSLNIVIGSQGVQFLNDCKYTIANPAVDYMSRMYPSDHRWIKRTVKEVGEEITYFTYLRSYPGVYGEQLAPMLAVSVAQDDFMQLLRTSNRTLAKDEAILLVEADGTIWAAEDSHSNLVGSKLKSVDNNDYTINGETIFVAEALSGKGSWHYAIVKDGINRGGYQALVTVWAILCVVLLVVGLYMVLKVMMKHYAEPIQRIARSLSTHKEDVANDHEWKLNTNIQLLQIESALSDISKMREERDYFTTHNKPLLRQSWFNCFVHGEAHYSAPQPQLDIHFQYLHFQVVIPSRTPETSEMDAIKQVFDEENWIVEIFESREKETVFLFNHEQKADALPEMLRHAGAALDEMQSDLVFGVGILSEGDELVAASFRCARRALSMRYFEKDQRVCVFDPEARHAEAESALTQIITQLTELTGLIRKAPQEDVDTTIDTIVAQLKETTPYLNTMRSIMLLAAMFLSKVVYDMKTAPESVYGENLLNAYYHISDISEFAMRLKQDCNRLRGYLTQESSPGNRSVVQYAIHHIQNSDPAELSIHSIAESIGISTGHLSRMFHQETGRKLIDYLQQMRMEHAARLLAEGQLTNEEICERIGYSRLQYFAGKFKEHYGITLNEYRRNSQSEAL